MTSTSSAVGYSSPGGSTMPRHDLRGTPRTQIVYRSSETLSDFLGSRNCFTELLFGEAPQYGSRLSVQGYNNVSALNVPQDLGRLLLELLYRAKKDRHRTLHGSSELPGCRLSCQDLFRVSIVSQ